MNILLEFTAFFAFLLVLGYLAPAGMYYWLYHLNAEKRELEPLQARRPSQAQIVREIKLSLVTILIFAVMSTGLYQLYKADLTSIYWRFRDYPVGYGFLSVFLCLVIHDTYFYWSHRFMHWQPVFKYMHLGHHRSVSPTPWAIFAFQPAEAVVQFIGISLLVLFLPLHPLALLAFLWIDTQINTAGHTGYELVPRFISQSRWFKGLNTVTHHDSHHTHMDKNYGAFFNVWDRWMGTLLEDEQVHAEPENIEGAVHAQHESPVMEEKSSSPERTGRGPVRPPHIGIRGKRFSRSKQR
ncbi:Fatty acid hydroxylase superfamily protein [Anatilimnocola aggregata]|uniref:Fatty acid hydroxylase superfamily protein n=1 Tax=Anatilimnocola aggregata TaxID=2528021 RepID=A0A517Y8G4_9BACT|nr:sterol desaturase family protein [Anatilimnocola aggregata]QDU26432.1 Fatty acid hydroxylase superfamily protein [Anatilimnocola aggregata]